MLLSKRCCHRALIGLPFIYSDDGTAFLPTLSAANRSRYHAPNWIFALRTNRVCVCVIVDCSIKYYIQFAIGFFFLSASNFAVFRHIFRSEGNSIWKTNRFRWKIQFHTFEFVHDTNEYVTRLPLHLCRYFCAWDFNGWRCWHRHTVIHRIGMLFPLMALSLL